MWRICFNYRYLLFVTQVLPAKVDYLNQPALALSQTEDPYFPTMADIFGLKLNADLVVLTACNTGMGEAVRSEGLIGPSRAMMYAGTSALAVTLWPVDSAAKASIEIYIFGFPTFYSIRIKHGEGNRETITKLL